MLVSLRAACGSSQISHAVLSAVIFVTSLIIVIILLRFFIWLRNWQDKTYGANIWGYGATGKSWSIDTVIVISHLYAVFILAAHAIFTVTMVNAMRSFAVSTLRALESVYFVLLQ